MHHCDALIVGGGPAGSTCARRLRQADWNVVVLDRARFPRDKVCAGWITPEVFPLLELDPVQYRDAGLTLQEIRGFRTGLVRGQPVETRYEHVVSYAIRRCEFDDFLLRRADVTVQGATPATSLRRDGTNWIVNDAFAAPVLVGAGGHFCPVARQVRGAENGVPVIAQEAEFPADGPTNLDENLPELFFCRDLDGYGWCLRKGNYVNVGIGRRHAEDFAAHRRDFIAFVESSGRVPNVGAMRWRGHAYMAAGVDGRPLVADGLLLVGDAAGLAYPESGEGIRPAIESGLAAAEALIAAGGRYDASRLRPYEDAMRHAHPPARRSPLPEAITAALGRALMRSHLFARRAIVEKWFLRL